MDIAAVAFERSYIRLAIHTDPTAAGERVKVHFKKGYDEYGGNADARAGLR